MFLGLTGHRVGGRGARGGAGGADHAGVAAADAAHPPGAGAAVAAPLPALPGAAGSQPGAVLPDVAPHLVPVQGKNDQRFEVILYLTAKNKTKKIPLPALR